MSEIIDNYKALGEERGWDDETTADHIEACGDKALADAYREAASQRAEAEPESAVMRSASSPATSTTEASQPSAMATADDSEA